MISKVWETVVRGVVVAAAVALIGLSAARADEQVEVVGNVRVTAVDSWPDQVSRGYLPLIVHLENTADESRTVSLIARNGYREGTMVTSRVRLDSGARTRLDLILPAFTASLDNTAPTYSLEIRCDGKDNTMHSLGAIGGVDARMKCMMTFARNLPAPGSPESWSVDISTEQLEPEYHTWGGGSAPARVSNVELVAATFDQMPRRYEPYTSLHAVVIDTSRGMPPREALQPLYTYARLGGVLCFFGRDAKAAILADEDLACWTERRFVIADRNVSTYHMGFGTLMVGDSDELFGDPVQIGSLQALLADQKPFVPVRESRLVRSLIVPGVGDLPYRTFVVLLILFAIVIGPVNFVFVKKVGRPALLLVTIPAIAFVTSVMLLAYGIFYQGIDTKSSSVSLTLLDQRNDRVEVVEDRQCFVGLSRGPGLLPGAGTSCYPVEVAAEDPRFLIDATQGVVLSGSFLPIREPVHQLLLAERASRLRLDVQPDGDKVVVENGLGVSIDQVIVRESDGTWYVELDEIDAGARAELDRVDSVAELENLRAAWKDEFGRGTMMMPDGIPLGAYMARLSEPVFTDDCGVDLNELDGRHGVIGLLDREELR